VKLTELEPEFVRYETRTDVAGPREYTIPVTTIGEAQGVEFLCPVCFVKNGGAVGTHWCGVTFAGRGATDDQGSHNREGKPSRWQVSGTDFTDLTLQPSIDLTPACSWHGFITNGEIR
jgi:hypothetical protein